MASHEDASSAPDFWSFVALAQKRLPELDPQSDIDATRTLLTLNRASDLITYDLESSIHRPQGSSWSGFRLLYVIWLAGPMEASKAARLTNMSRAAVSNLITTLVNRGMLVRTADPDDRRAITLSLSDEGLATTERIYRKQNERESEWASALTPAERDVLVHLLEKMLGHRAEIDGRMRE
jgi:DNA-binding MarR family transcriptional regulator